MGKTRRAVRRSIAMVIVAAASLLAGSLSASALAGQQATNASTGPIGACSNCQSPVDPQFGDGRDGDLVVPDGQVRILTPRTEHVSASGQSAHVASSSGFGPGDQVVVHQQRGSAVEGRWERAEVASVAGPGDLTLRGPLQRTYDDAAGRAVIVRLFQFRTITIGSNASLTTTPFDGSTGGSLALAVSDTTTIASGGKIDVGGLGLRGGSGGRRTGANNGPERNGIQGEGRYGPGGRSTNPNDSGGGGGGADLVSGDGGGGGGGGSHSTAGTDGTIATIHPYQGIGHGATTVYGSADLAIMLPGGGGGGGAADDNDQTIGGNGGVGGGLLWGWFRTVTGDGSMDAAGRAGAAGIGCGNGAGGGGGGAGGSIHLVTASSNPPALAAGGGAGGEPGCDSGRGGAGALGRTAIEYVAPTAMTASPAVLQTSPLGVNAFTLRAKLSRSDSHSPVADRSITFTAGGTDLCAATTDAAGVATCTALSPSAVSVVLSQGYAASFAGDSGYLASSADAGLIGTG